jgi:hypothetical protein
MTGQYCTADAGEGGRLSQYELLRQKNIEEQQKVRNVR